MLQSMHESISMPAHWGSVGFFILTYSKSLYFRVSILTGRRAAWVPDSDPGGWQESLISQHSRTYYSLERQKGGHSYSYLTEEETEAWQCRFTDGQ